MLYALAKALHLIVMVIWLAGMVFVPLMVRSFGAEGPPLDVAARLRRVFSLLCTPAMIAVWALGLWIASSGGWLTSSWLLAKMAVVIVLSGLHGAMVGQLRRAATDRGTTGALGVLHWPVLILLTVIVLLAVVRPI